MQELEKIQCQEIKYIGSYDIKGLLPYNIKRNWELQRKKIKYEIEIVTVFNSKTVTIKISMPVKFAKAYKLLSEILKYECLYDGRFFKIDKLEIDGKDKTNAVKSYMLSYYGGGRSYTILSQPINDMVYKRGFCAWERYNKQLLLVNQMFFYIGFSEGITADLRIALFSEIYEPISEFLSKEGKLQLINSKPFNVKNAKCPQCGNKYKIQKSIDPSFNDKITSVVQVFGVDIFAGDDISSVIKKTVNTRNKMLHVVEENKDYLNGGQCGFYMGKYFEIYRMIVLQQIKIWNLSMDAELKAAIDKYNRDFSKFRIK